MSSDSAGGRDPSLEAYVEAVEGTMRTRRGVDHVLSPREFALARGWHDAGIPLATVLVAIDLAFDAEPSVTSLVFCRRRVEQLAAGPSRADAPKGLETGRPHLPELTEQMEALKARLRELPPRAAALSLSEVDEVADLVAVASRPNWDYLAERLQNIDALVSTAAVEALEPEVLDELRAEARQAAARHAGRVDGGALQEAMERRVRQRARERLKLPRVSLL